MTKNINTDNFVAETKTLIDELKAVCASYGLGNDGNEFNIICHIFLYTLRNDKVAFEITKLKPARAESEHWGAELAKLDEHAYNLWQSKLGADTAFLYPHQLIGHLFDRQNEPDFAQLIGDALMGIAAKN